METKIFSGDFKCKNCRICKGYGCIGELPGMGGVNNSHNFILNCNAWSLIREALSAEEKSELNGIIVHPSDIGIAPVTGAVQNIGFTNEKDFYLPYFKSAEQTDAFICVGDGCPDEKLDLGIQAVSELNEKAYFFLKPYPNEVLFKRIDKVRSYAKAVGMDIDAYNIVTMRNQVNLERKTQEQIENLKKYAGIPFMLKGIFTEEDVALCTKVHPDIAVVSNHGGRVDTNEGSSADFLDAYCSELKQCCGEVWVDGGIRTFDDVKTAKYLGADKVLVGRPFISSLCFGGIDAMKKAIQLLSDNNNK